MVFWLQGALEKGVWAIQKCDNEICRDFHDNTTHRQAKKGDSSSNFDAKPLERSVGLETHLGLETVETKRIEIDARYCCIVSNIWWPTAKCRFV